MHDRAAPESPFGELLRFYRRRLGLSQPELAERSGLTVSAISALERGARGRPYPYSARQLADALELDDADREMFLNTATRPATAQSKPAQPAPVPPSASRPPWSSTPLIGRAVDLASLQTRISRPTTGRLMTLTGLAGMGKTRLALQLASEVGPTFPDGVWFVGLAPIDDPADVARAVAETCGVREALGEQIIDRLVAFLQQRHALLILDNCEHLADACAELLRRLLSGCPSLSLITTSREPFHIAGEQIWRLPPLAVPRLSGTTSAEQIAGVATVQLFIERAQGVDPHFQLTDANAQAIADICVRLEGIPLAIELAAAWVRVLKVEQVAARLADMITVVPGGNRTNRGRQQTLQAALEWRYSLLQEQEQRLFERLSVFRGGADLELVEAVCHGGDLPEQVILGLMAQLVDKSLVQVEDGGPVARYRLLEPVRLFAAERLVAVGEVETIAAQHADAFRALAQRAAAELDGPRQIDWLQRLDRDQDNIRTALRRFAEYDDAQSGLRMAVALAPFWSIRGHAGEGRRWLDAMLTLPSAAAIGPDLRARVLLRSGDLAIWQLDLDEARALLEESVALAREIDDGPTQSEALSWLSTICWRRGDTDGATEALKRALEVARPINDQPAIALALLSFGLASVNVNDLTTSRAYFEDSLARYVALGNPRYIAIANTLLGEVLRRLGDVGRARQCLRDGLAGHLAVGDQAFLLVSLWQIATMVAAEQPERVARILGAVQSVHAAHGTGQSIRNALNSVEETMRRTDTEDTLATLQALLPDDVLGRAVAEGRAMTAEQAGAEALAAVNALSGIMDRLLNT